METTHKFPIEHLNNKWYVSWTERDFTRTQLKNQLLDVLFKQLQVDEVGLSIKLQGSEYDIMYISYPLWAQDKSGQYSQFIYDMYDIRGLVFKQKNEAEVFREYLLKTYIWKELQR